MQDLNSKQYTLNSYSTLWTFARLRVTTAKDGHLPSLGWSPTNLKLVTHQKELWYILGIWHYILQARNLALRLNSQNEVQVTTARNGHLSSRGWSPFNPSMVTYHKDIYYRLGIHE